MPTAVTGLAPNVNVVICQYMLVIAPALLLACPTNVSGVPLDTVNGAGTVTDTALLVEPDPLLLLPPPPQADKSNLSVATSAR